ncbi:3-oxo-5-alpha-steroid 4-dehydrogenase 1 isoform X2 [Carassius gibelio]|uniref:3-oxo-5-alpha-steroid 4-dehydrogenase 1 isoform X2 n=1 Tax=Carassius gibelio TaxID=101364 RepID=UPI00227979B3|nr:3-oxo-5-alpha-steroid 4-dehydrogenase 1 isoform X2 [Carassius gibelio]
MDAIQRTLFLSEEQEVYVLVCLSYLMMVMGFITFVTLLYEHVPYGRYASSRYGFPVNVKLAWFVQELPAFLVPLSLVLWRHCAKITHLPNQLLLLMFIFHYLQRSLIYPFLIRGGKSTPLISFVLAFVFCIYNGYLQARYLSHYADYPPGWVTHPCFIIGGLFEYVSGANFFGEIVEWSGFALAAHSVHSAAFALFTLIVLCNRGVAHHKWYLTKFEDYPKSRKALIPFVF